MRRTPSLSTALLSLALLAALADVRPLDAQESTTRGFTLGLHLGGANLTVEDGDGNGAGGGGLFFGYGFNRTVQLYLQLDGHEFDVDDSEVQGTWTMGHGDLGVRFHFANSLRSWVPYLQAGLTGRVVSVEDAVVEGNPETDVTLSGGALTVGGGFLFYFNETLAADLQLLWSGGRFTEITVDNVTLSGLEVDANSGRFNVGVVWWP